MNTYQSVTFPVERLVVRGIEFETVGYSGGKAVLDSVVCEISVRRAEASASSGVPKIVVRILVQGLHVES